jgi:glycerol-3-phosphate dehydrogenase
MPCQSFFQALYYYSGCLVYHWLYRLHSQDRFFLPPRFITRAYMDAVCRGLAENYRYGVVYDDAMFNDARVNVELLLKAEEVGPVQLLNRATLTHLHRDPSTTQIQATIKDNLTHQSTTIHCSHIVSCAGAFSDAVRAMADGNIAPSIRCVAGTHLVYRQGFASASHAVCVPYTSDGRILFVIPFYDRLIVGTT